jgi:alpha-D-xyloside xylohydrolase
MFARWAYGYFQSKERYVSQEDLLQTAKEYRDRQLPLDCIVQDWFYWPGSDYFSGFEFDKARFPDVPQLVESLHKMDVKLMISVWPAFGRASGIFKEFQAKGFLFENATHWTAEAKLYDPYSAAARRAYWGYFERAMGQIDAWWLDGSEPELLSTDDRFITEILTKQMGGHSQGSFTRFLNTFSLMTTKGNP